MYALCKCIAWGQATTTTHSSEYLVLLLTPKKKCERAKLYLTSFVELFLALLRILFQFVILLPNWVGVTLWFLMRCHRSQLLLLLFFINRHQKLPLTRPSSSSSSCCSVKVNWTSSLFGNVCVRWTRLTHSPCRIDLYKASKTPDGGHKKHLPQLHANCFLLFPIFIASPIRFIARTHPAGPRNVAT